MSDLAIESSTLACPNEFSARKNHVRIADAENRIDGIFRDPKTEAVFKAYIDGEIAVTDIVVKLHALLGSR